jgi:hypothetical protein
MWMIIVEVKRYGHEQVPGKIERWKICCLEFLERGHLFPQVFQDELETLIRYDSAPVLLVNSGYIGRQGSNNAAENGTTQKQSLYPGFEGYELRIALSRRSAPKN